MRRSIMLVLVAALMLTVTVGATASVAAGPSAEAQAAARRGRRAARCPTGRRAVRGRRAARCRARRRAAPGGGKLADGQYYDPRTGARLEVGGGQAEVGIPASNGSCPGTGALVTARGPISEAGGTARASGAVQPISGVTINWALTVRSPALTYALEIDYVLQLPGQSPCQDRRLLTGTLAKF